MKIANLRRFLIVALAGAVAYGAWELTREPVDPFLEDAEGTLRDRFASYVELRKQDDWTAIWEMVDPVEREQMDLPTFMGVYGQGVMKTNDIVERDLDINFNTRRALLAVTTDAELVVSKLPPQYRASLRVDDPADLRRKMEHDLGWVWRNGEWYFSLDAEVLGGVDAQGRTVSPVAAGS